mgnify:FL=1
MRTGKAKGGRPRRQVDGDRIRALAAQGCGLRKIARETGLGYGTVHRILRRREEAPAVIQNPLAGVL